ncbi:MAG: T9SS type A sorting domain-containing protein [Ignavibacteria bacterium]|nr:T9SS type A sorting domain-containing protein [Ignavibacteria bacterium]
MDFANFIEKLRDESKIPSIIDTMEDVIINSTYMFGAGFPEKFYVNDSLLELYKSRPIFCAATLRYYEPKECNFCYSDIPMQQLYCIDDFDGINDELKPTQANIYPNPANANSMVTIELNPSQVGSGANIVLYDMLGNEIKQIYNEFVGANDYSPLHITFSTQELPKGIYYLKILSGGDVKVEKVVVR